MHRTDIRLKLRLYKLSYAQMTAASLRQFHRSAVDLLDELAQLNIDINTASIRFLLWSKIPPEARRSFPRNYECIERSTMKLMDSLRDKFLRDEGSKSTSSPRHASLYNSIGLRTSPSLSPWRTSQRPPRTPSDRHQAAQKQFIASPPATRPLRTTTSSIQVKAQPSSILNENRNNRENASHLAHTADDSLPAGFGGANHPAHTAGGLSPAKCGAGTSDVNQLTDQATVEPNAIQRDGPVSGNGAPRETPIQPAIAAVEGHRESPRNVTAPASRLQQQPASEVCRCPCAFCSHPGHRSTHCLNYATFEKRMLRAARRSVCVACCSLQPEPHLWKECPHESLQCSHCKQKSHHQGYCRSWLRIFSNRISRHRPQTIIRENPTRGRSPSTRAQASSRRTAKKPCQQLRCTCHRDDCQYVIPLVKSDSDVAALSRAAKTLSVTPSPATPITPKLHAEQSKPASSSPPCPCMRDRLRATIPLLIGAGGKPFNGAATSSRRTLPQLPYATPADVHGDAESFASTIHGCNALGNNLPAREKEQQALDAELDSDNDSYLTHGSPYAATPYARPHSPSGGFGPHIGREDEAPEDFAPTAEDENYWPDEPTSKATFMAPKRHASETGRGSELGYHHAYYGPNAQQTARDADYEDRFYADGPYEDGYNGPDLYEDQSYEADFYEDDVYAGDFYDDDAVY